MDIPGKAGDSATHGFHQYVASFHPELAGYFLDKFGWEGCRVLDPFCGGGTTAVESVLRKMRFCGFDTNPMACFISRVKTTPIPGVRDKVDSFWGYLGKYSENLGSRGIGTYASDGESIVALKDFTGRKEYLSLSLQKHRAFAKYFSEDNYKALCWIKDCIDRYFTVNQDDAFRDFVNCAFSSILRDCSNLGNDSFEYYIDKDKSLATVSYPWNWFPTRLYQMVQGIEQLNRLYGNISYSPANITEGSSARRTYLDDNSINLVVTSPPYGEAVPYNRVFSMHTDFLGMRVQRYHRDEIGFRDTNPRKTFTESDLGSKLAVETVRKITSGDSSASVARQVTLSKKMPAYYVDLFKVWQELGRVVKSGGFIVWVVGNNTVWKQEHGPTAGYGHPTGELFDNVRISAEQAVSSGFRLRKIVRLRGYVLTKIADESAVILEKI
jgi:tRNA G10  N-methylase Trm11